MGSRVVLFVVLMASCREPRCDPDTSYYVRYHANGMEAGESLSVRCPEGDAVLTAAADGRADYTCEKMVLKGRTFELRIVAQPPSSTCAFYSGATAESESNIEGAISRIIYCSPTMSVDGGVDGGPDADEADAGELPDAGEHDTGEWLDASVDALVVDAAGDAVVPFDATVIVDGGVDAATDLGADASAMIDMAEDLCPLDPEKLVPGVCGCGAVEDLTDTDSDMTPDCVDACPNDVATTTGYTFYRDADDDMYGDADDTTTACEAPSGYTTNGSDCDDSRDDVHPALTELCSDTLDNDCNGDVDDDDEACAYVPPAGCTLVVNEDDGGRRYLFCDGPSTFGAASSTCSSGGGFDLVVVNDADEYDFITDFVNEEAGWPAGSKIYLGYNLDFFSGQFVPVTGGTMSFDRWWITQPDRQSMEWCVAQNVDDDFWYDERCDMNLQFICEDN